MLEGAEEYHGPFVILRPDGMGFTVTVEPPLGAHDRSRTYADKNSAWGYARDLWGSLHLPFRDECDGNTCRSEQSENSRLF